MGGATFMVAFFLTPIHFQCDWVYRGVGLLKYTKYIV